MAAGLAVLGVLLVPGAPAQGLQTAESALPRPSWWGGSVEDLEGALALSGDWCRRERELTRLGRTQAWCLENGSWGIGAAVALNPESDSDRRELKDSLRMLASNRALRGIVASKWGTPDLGALAIEGASYESVGNSISADLSSGPRVQTYVEGEVLFVISLLDRSSIENLAMSGQREFGIAALAARGIVRQPATEDLPLTALVTRALELDASSTTLKAVAKRCVEDEDGEAAKILLRVPSNPVLDIGETALALSGALESLIGRSQGLAARLLVAGDLAGRVELVAEEVRRQGLTGLPIQLLLENSPAVFLVLDGPASTDLARRTAHESLLALDGSLRIPRLAMMADGSISADEDVLPVGPGGKVLHSRNGLSWILVRSAEALDGPLDFSGPRLRVTAPPAESGLLLVGRAALARAVQLGLWSEISNGSISRVCRDPKLLELVTWSVELEEGDHEVDFRPSIDEVLRGARQRDPFTVHLERAAPMSQGFQDALDRSLLECGAVLQASSSARVDLVMSAEVRFQPQESGEDDGSILVGKKPWVQVPVEVALTAHRDEAMARIVASQRTQKVYGGHDPEPYTDAAALVALRQCLEKLPSTLANLLDSTGEVIVASATRKELSPLVLAAERFGGVRELPQANSEEPLVRVKLLWPGGEAGLRRALEALRDLPDWNVCSSLQIVHLTANGPR